LTGEAAGEAFKVDESGAVAGTEVFISVAEPFVRGIAVTRSAGSGVMAFVVGVASLGGSTGVAGVMVLVVWSNGRLMLH
jgi:hypothetical protein